MDNPIRRQFPIVAASRKLSNETRALVSKLAPDPHGSRNNSSRQNTPLPDMRVFGHIANKTISNISDARNLFQVLPDMDYARQILISATLSPGDLVGTDLLFSMDGDDMDSSLTGPMLREVQKFFEDSYRIRRLLPKILNDVLFMRGSYPILTIPESSIDRIINSDDYKTTSLEAAVTELNLHLNEQTVGGMYKPRGVLGFPGAKTGVSFESQVADGSFAQNCSVSWTSLESMTAGAETDQGRALGAVKEMAKHRSDSVIVTDNENILKRPMVLETKRKLSIQRVYGGRRHTRHQRKVSNESGTRTLNEVENTFYAQRRYQNVPVQPVLTRKQAKGPGYGHPLVMHLPSESVIPICVPGNPSEHVGYFVLLDINGNPLNISMYEDYYDDIRGQLQATDQFSSSVLQQARRGLDGTGTISNELISEMTRIHSDVIENDVKARLRSGLIDGEYELARPEYITQVMFSRHLKGQKTIMLYVPAEMMNYIAFDYNEFGVGKSLLEDGKILGSIRAALMLSNTLATINNAVGGKTINIQLDEKDDNPAETVEFLLSQNAQVNSEGFSRIIGSTHPLGLADQIQNHGVNVVIEGNTRYPATKFDVQRREGTSSPIDMEYEKQMMERHYKLFGLPAEMAEGLNQADFATTVVNNNLMLLKRVVQNQEDLEPFLIDFIRNYVFSSGILYDELVEMVSADRERLNKLEDYDDTDEGVDMFVQDFISKIKVELPSPELNNIEKDLEKYNKYKEATTEMINAYINTEGMIAEGIVGLDEVIEPVKNAVIAEYLRRFMRSKNIMPELDVFNSLDEDESPVFNFMKIASEHQKGLTMSLMEYIQAVLKGRKTIDAAKTALDKERAKYDTPEMTGGDMGGGDGLGDGDDGLGGMDGDLGDDLGGGGTDGLDLDDSANLDDPNSASTLDEPASTDDTPADPESVSEEPAEAPAETGDEAATLAATAEPVEEEPASTEPTTPAAEENDSIIEGEATVVEEPADPVTEEEEADPAVAAAQAEPDANAEPEGDGTGEPPVEEEELPEEPADNVGTLTDEEELDPDSPIDQRRATESDDTEDEEEDEDKDKDKP